MIILMILRLDFYMFNDFPLYSAFTKNFADVDDFVEFGGFLRMHLSGFYATEYLWMYLRELCKKRFILKVHDVLKNLEIKSIFVFVSK